MGHISYGKDEWKTPTKAQIDVEEALSVCLDRSAVSSLKRRSTVRMMALCRGRRKNADIGGRVHHEATS